MLSLTRSIHGIGGITPIGPFSEGELLIILLIILIVMGLGRLPQLARALGEAMREFRKVMSGEYEEGRRRKEKPKEEQEYVSHWLHHMCSSIYTPLLN